MLLSRSAATRWCTPTAVAHGEMAKDSYQREKFIHALRVSGTVPKHTRLCDVCLVYVVTLMTDDMKLMRLMNQSEADWLTGLSENIKSSS